MFPDFQGKSWQEIPRSVHVYETKSLDYILWNLRTKEGKKGKQASINLKLFISCKEKKSTRTFMLDE